MIIKNDKGREFFIRVVMKGDRYGLKDCLTHTEDSPMIEFYDYTYAGDKDFGPRGQFVTRYYAETLSGNVERKYGLDLCGHVNEWSVDEKACKPVIELANRLVRK